MNPRRIHQLVLKNFPSVNLTAHDWVNVLDRDGPRVNLIDALLEQHIPSSDVIVEVHRKLGVFLPKPEALSFICGHIGEGQMRIADREFTSFVVILPNGVATGWDKTTVPATMRKNAQ